MIVHLKYYPLYKLTPIIEKTNNTHPTIAVTFKIEITESNKADINNFRSLLCEINLKGLNTLNILRILMNGKFIDVSDMSKIEKKTIMKSKIFQLSLR